MGFGKKKKKNAEPAPAPTPVKPVKVDMQHNPLYPPKRESDLKEVLSAAGTTVVSLILVGLIISKFSYVNRVDAYGTNTELTQSQIYEDEGQNPEMEDLSEEDMDLETEDANDEEDGRMTDEADREEQEDGSEEDESDEEEQEENKDYVLADSNSRYISDSDLANLTQDELSHARNEIYARHGRRFKDAGLQSYFDGKSWYSGTIEPDQFSEGMLNEYEKKNAETILAYERAKGYR